MRIIILALLLLSLSPLSFSLSPFSLLLLSEESNEEESEFEFPPPTLPVIDEDFMNTHNRDILALSSTGAIAGIGLIIYGIYDLIAQAGTGYYSYAINKGIVCVSAGLILGGISVAFLKPALDSLR